MNQPVLPILLAALALVLTGCPRDQYTVELTPRGDHLERTLTLYREDGVNTNTGAPNYLPFDSNRLAAISRLYPAGGLTSSGHRHVAHGAFTGRMPDDVGGAGSYTNLITSLGMAGFYVERFRGNDDLAAMTEKRFHAADQVADLVAGWMRAELRRDPGYDKLRRFLELDFRQDLRNFGAYLWEAQVVGGYQTNATEELVVRFGQYLFERGYFSAAEIPALSRALSGEDAAMPALMRQIPRLVARKMGVPESEPAPPSLAFLGDETAMQQSFDKYLAGTGQYRAKLRHWEKEQKLTPGLKKPAPSEVFDEASGGLVELDLFGQPDHLVVRLALPSPPVHANGRWDAALRQVVWETDIEGRTNATHFPYFCYASWVGVDAEFQKAHIGKVALAGDDLAEYCLWRNRLGAGPGREWDTFIASLQPGPGLLEKLEAFRFSGEPRDLGTNGPAKLPGASTYPRELLKAALQ